MSKVGRNDPCPCGSGKKYKKCCIDKETSIFSEELKNDHDVPSDDRWEDEETNDSLFGLNDFNEENEEFYDQDSPETDDDSEYIEEEILDEDKNRNDEDLPGRRVTNDDPRYFSQLKEDTTPKISKKEEKLIDEWYLNYGILKNPFDIKNHIEDFMGKYPRLVENMELHHEVIFELAGDFLKIDRYDEFIEFLFQFRSKFPESYLKSFGFYDYNIVVWLISKNRIEEIPQYLENFIKYPVDFVDKLFELLDLLCATNNSSFALSLVNEIYPFVFYSKEVFGGDSIVSPLIIDQYSKILHPDYTDNEIDQLVESLKKIKVDLWDQYYNSEFWKSLFGIMLKPFSKWEESVPRKKAEFHRLHSEMINNYHRFLKEKTGVSWITANFFTEKLSKYFHLWVEDSPKPHKVLFDFSQATIDETIGPLIRNMIWIDFTGYVGYFNAIYYFADYLFVCGNIDAIQRDKIQADCSALYNKPLEQFKKQYDESLALNQFPLWGKIQYQDQ